MTSKEIRPFSIVKSDRVRRRGGELPVLLIIFRRPDLTRLVLEAIRTYAPPRIYIAADGPRESIPGERELVLGARAAALGIDWECEIHTLFREQNLGCGPSVKGAIDWFFSNESEGIILEDDCLPSAQFFRFCEDLLDRYRHEENVGMIAGFNPISYVPRYGSTYFFSAIPNTWGWATWRRAWKHMDFQMRWRKTPQYRNVLRFLSPTIRLRYFWLRSMRLIDTGIVSAWDWQWYFSLALRRQLTAIPSQNLVENIGFDDRATHTTKATRGVNNTIGRFSTPIVHPKQVFADRKYGRSLSRHTYPDERPLVAGTRLLNRKVWRPTHHFFYRKVRRLLGIRSGTNSQR